MYQHDLKEHCIGNLTLKIIIITIIILTHAPIAIKFSEKKK